MTCTSHHIKIISVKFNLRTIPSYIDKMPRNPMSRSSSSRGSSSRRSYLPTGTRRSHQRNMSSFEFKQAIELINSRTTDERLLSILLSNAKKNELEKLMNHVLNSGRSIEQIISMIRLFISHGYSVEGEDSEYIAVHIKRSIFKFANTDSVFRALISGSHFPREKIFDEQFSCSEIYH